MAFAQTFIKINASEADNRIQAGDKITLFVGRPSCPFCRLFEPKLVNVSEQLGGTVYFLNSEDFKDGVGIQSLRTQYGIPTVPGLLVANNGVVKVICDSSISESTISDFITAI